ncbi:hypothetical protein [Thauera humireducens]|uniref:hypothetical protein n=1 Tax=Thauera humireducens TaxID=1134435 RepID=UPI00311E31DA
MRVLLALTAALLAAGCATAPEEGKSSSMSRALQQAEQVAGDYGGPVAAIAGGLMMLSDLKMLEPEYIAGGLIAFAIYDPSPRHGASTCARRARTACAWRCA